MHLKQSTKQIHAGFIALVWGINQTQVSNEICKSWEEEKNVYTYTLPLKVHKYI